MEFHVEIGRRVRLVREGCFMWPLENKLGWGGYGAFQSIHVAEDKTVNKGNEQAAMASKRLSGVVLESFIIARCLDVKREQVYFPGCGERQGR